MSRFVLLLAACLVAASPSLADDLPAQLLIGYENEGDVDASPAACEETVRELVEWSDAETKEAITMVCTARKAHVDAYAALQASYRKFAKVFGEDTRLDVPAAVAHFQQMIKECIDHKSALTTGGHNIAIDIIPNHIAANCLEWGKRIMDDETAWYEQPAEQHTRAAP